MKSLALRKAYRQLHRRLAVFAVLQCWFRGLDGVVLDKSHLQRILGLKKFKRIRVDWLSEDFRDFFPYREPFWVSGKVDETGNLNSFACLWVSCKEIKPFLGPPNAGIPDRLAQIPKHGPRMEMFALWPEAHKASFKTLTTPASASVLAELLGLGDMADRDYDEWLLSSYLTLLCHGDVGPGRIPGLGGRAAK
jgi:hypothetical protein